MHNMNADGKVLDQKAFTDSFEHSTDLSCVVTSLQKLIPKTGEAKIGSDSTTPVKPFHNEPEIMAVFEDMERSGGEIHNTSNGRGEKY